MDTAIVAMNMPIPHDVKGETVLQDKSKLILQKYFPVLVGNENQMCRHLQNCTSAL